MFAKSFKDGNSLYIKLTVFFSFFICVVMWISEQYLGFPASEYMFFTFSGIAVSGMGLKVIDKKVNKDDLPEKAE